jgi:hypothetical protein
MQFKVPQFLDIEDKIFGPFTFREFVYLAGGAGLCFVLYKALGFWIGIIPMLLIAGLSLALTFYHPNDKPFINMIESAMKYLVQDKLFIWKRREVEKNKTKDNIYNMPKSTTQMDPRLGNSKLKDLAWSLDILSSKSENNKSS